MTPVEYLVIGSHQVMNQMNLQAVLTLSMILNGTIFTRTLKRLAKESINVYCFICTG
jgi:hypothetical protein